MTNHDAQNSANVPFDPDTCGFAVFGSQGGGLVRWDVALSDYVFVEAPEGIPELKVGDRMTSEWGVGGPVNDEAMEAMHADENEDLDPLVRCMLDLANL